MNNLEIQKKWFLLIGVIVRGNVLTFPEDKVPERYQTILPTWLTYSESMQTRITTLFDVMSTPWSAKWKMTDFTDTKIKIGLTWRTEDFGLMLTFSNLLTYVTVVCYSSLGMENGLTIFLRKHSFINWVGGWVWWLLRSLLPLRF